jgi:chromosome segregation ATPase
MENKFDLDYLKSLYESLDVSDGAKNRFFETFLKEAQAEANPNAKKAGLIHKFLAWLNKGTPTVESSAQAILEALTGIERIIQTSPLLVNDKLRGERDLKYLEKYKTQIERATQGIIDAQAKNKEAQDRFFQSNPQVQNAQTQLDQAAEAETQELERFQNRIEGANGNSKELQKIKTELEQKLQEVKAQAGNDEDAGEEYEELIEKIDELLKANPEDTSNPEENPEGEEASTESEDTADAETKTEEVKTEDDKIAEKIKDNETGKTGGVSDLNVEEEQLRQFESTTPINTDKKLAE